MTEPVDNVVQLMHERSKRIHDIHEKRLGDLQQAFAKAFPLPSGKKAKSKKKR